MVSDRSIGTIGLLVSCCTLAYLFFHLMIVPVLPLADDNPLKLSPPTVVLGICGLFSFSVIGTLIMYTFYFMYKNR